MAQKYPEGSPSNGFGKQKTTEPPGKDSGVGARMSEAAGGQPETKVRWHMESTSVKSLAMRMRSKMAAGGNSRTKGFGVTFKGRKKIKEEEETEDSRDEDKTCTNKFLKALGRDRI